MDFEQVFSLASLAAMIGWIVLALTPIRRPFMLGLARCIGVGLAVAYAVQLGLSWGRSDGGFGSLAEVKRLFSVDGVLLAGWIHYLAFDLWVGAWEVEDAHRRGLNHWLLLPSLFLTFMFGPVGLLSYLVLRGAAGAWKANRK